MCCQHDAPMRTKRAYLGVRGTRVLEEQLDILVRPRVRADAQRGDQDTEHRQRLAHYTHHMSVRNPSSTSLCLLWNAESPLNSSGRSSIHWMSRPCLLGSQSDSWNCGEIRVSQGVAEYERESGHTEIRVSQVITVSGLIWAKILSIRARTQSHIRLVMGRGQFFEPVACMSTVWAARADVKYCTSEKAR